MTADEIFWNQVRGGLMMLVSVNDKSPAPSLEIRSALMTIVRAIETRHPVLVPPLLPGKPHKRHTPARRTMTRSDARSANSSSETK